MKKACIRCGGTENLEKDHIIPRANLGSDDRSNKRLLCTGCHDYRHTRDGILEEIDKWFHRVEKGHGNQAQLTMWVFRLGVLEWFNPPEKVRERGYMSYGKLEETYYSRWYEAIKLMRPSRDPYKAIIADNQAKLVYPNQ